MSRIKISENLFLEKNELVRLQKFFGEDGWQRAMRSLVKQYGVVQNEELSSFAVVASATANAVDVLPGLAYNSNMEAIVSDKRVTVPIGAAVSGQDKWVVLRRAVTNNEVGTVSIQTDGSLAGVGTEFTKVLRGQPNFPTKVRFTDSASNIYEYEVVSVNSDTSAVLSGSFVAQSGLHYAVVGTFTPGFTPSDGDKDIYEYDFFEIEVITSEAKPEVGANEFILAQLAYPSGGGVFSIVDLRGDCSFSSTEVNSGSEEGGSSNGKNPLLSLLAVRQVGGTVYGDKFLRLELIIEYAYKVISFDYVSTGDGWVLSISEGSCNAMNLTPAQIPNGTFDGFIVLNRDNMRSVKILSQTANTLLIKNDENTSQLLSENSDLIIVPDFTHLEVIARADSNVDMPEIPFTKETGAADGYLRMTVELEYPNGENAALESVVNMKLKYCMFSSSGHRGHPFSFNTANYQDYTDGVSKSVTDGNIAVNVGALVPTAEDRNYS